MLPRFVVAAPATGQGKTTVATGLMAALTRAGHAVSGHKVGPDYIDPGYHALACGRPGRNLDPHLVGEDRVVPLLLHGAQPADVAVLEGVMGLFDGRIGGEGFSSTAHVATLTRSPVVLVVDISRASRSVGAVVHGLATFAADVEIAGVILNQAGSPRHVAEVRSVIDLPVLGVLPRDESFATPSRHLGLVPAAERDQAAHALDRLADAVAAHVDLDAVLTLAAQAPDLDVAPWRPEAEVTAPSQRRPVVAMAGGRAFTFRYAETEELLRAAGCEVVTFDPLVDAALPAGTAGLYLGGGFPEVHAGDLAGNTSLLAELRQAVADGVPTVAECAGLLYLARTLDDVAMVGAVDADAAMSPRLTLRYPTATAPADSLLGRAGEGVTGHEFHRTVTTPAAGATPAWSVDGVDLGFAGPTLHASYLHTHWAGHPRLAQRFAEAVHEAAKTPVHRRFTPSATEVSVESGVIRRSTGVLPAAPPLTTDPLRHHGDTEASGMVDFAVNVYPGPPPSWLTEALARGLEQSGRYPDPTDAERALASKHGREVAEVVATAGAAAAFSLVSRLRPWRVPVVVHPQFTEPHAALEAAGHRVVVAHSPADFSLPAVPEDADLVVVGNPTNPTGVLHSRRDIADLCRPGRLVVVDEAFMDAVPGETESLAGTPVGGLLVVRSLTKHWGIPGVRAGYLLGEPEVVAALRRGQTPWSVSAVAAEAMLACATADPRERAETLQSWREHLEKALADLGVEHVGSRASFVLAKVGDGVRARLREQGIAVRRGDTFPGLGPDWVRIAARPPDLTDLLTTTLKELL